VPDAGLASSRPAATRAREVGLATVNVGSGGATMTLMDILLAADGHATHSSAAAGFVLYDGSPSLRGLADDLFERVNDLGDG
jgi:hypothetical protein